MKYSVVIPTLNGGDLWQEVVSSLRLQQPTPEQVLVIDSGSVDDTTGIAADADFDVIQIPQSEFDHGGTRNKGLGLLDEPYIAVFLTQDCVLKSRHSIHRLVSVFADGRVGACFGRQLPREDATAVEIHARGFNYPVESQEKSRANIRQLGIKTVFCSNVFSAYRADLLKQLGGFPARAIISEDMYVAAKLILEGYVVRYVADAQCVHSHNYTVLQEFRRSFDIGVFHSREKWLIDAFGHAESEGGKYVKSSLGNLAKISPRRIPAALYRFGMRFIGFKAGKLEQMIPLSIKRSLSMNRGFWNNE